MLSLWLAECDSLRNRLVCCRGYVLRLRNDIRFASNRSPDRRY